ncbi:acyl carrier protein [Nocardia sp. CA-129566]|uniref:acyl carrier protein n=1 Tax=Nocardia sp. CA-129566 TaxID=3239976 RepID=UPI003D97EFE3
MNDIHEVRAFICKNFVPDVAPAELAADLDLIGTGVIDSLSVLRIVAWLRDRYAIPVDEIDIAPDNFRSVASISDLIAEFGRQPARTRE